MGVPNPGDSSGCSRVRLERESEPSIGYLRERRDYPVVSVIPVSRSSTLNPKSNRSRNDRWPVCCEACADVRSPRPDPVYGMEVDTRNPPGGGYEHEGTTYYFCGRDCRLEFEQDPKGYLSGEKKMEM